MPGLPVSHMCQNLPLTCAAGTLAHVAHWVVKRGDAYLDATWLTPFLSKCQHNATRYATRTAAKDAAATLAGRQPPDKPKPRVVRLVPRRAR
jgi:hypothetical protein